MSENFGGVIELKSSIRRGLPAGTALLTVLGLSTTFGATTAWADSSTTPKVTLAQAKQIAQATFLVPSGYTLQNESFNSNNGGTQSPSYQFSFTNASPTGGGQPIYVTVNANDGTITSYNRQSPDNQFLFPVPISAAQAQQIANRWAEKLYPKQVSQVRSLSLTPTSGPLTGPTQYTYRYERMVNGIPAPFDGFSITVGQKGTLLSLQDHWTSLPFPSLKNVLGDSKAKSIYQAALALHLAYQPVYPSNGKPTVNLTYQLASQTYVNWWSTMFSNQNSISYPVIDASTGNVVDASGAIVTASPYTRPKPLVKGGPTLLTDPVKVNWTETQALQFAEKTLSIPASATLQNANQYASSNADVTWNFQWITTNQQNINVSVDATYGIMQNYSTYPGPYNTPPASPKSAKYTQAEINKAVDNLVEMAMANDTGAIAVVPTPFYGPKSSVETGFQILPLVHGVPDLARAGNVTFNLQTGGVQDFYINTQPMQSVYPNPSQAIPESKAVQDWMAQRPLTLEYLETQPQLTAKMNGKVPARQSTKAAQIKLVYAPEVPNSATGQFNALTGKFGGSNSKTSFTGQIKDLGGISAAPQIQLLVHRELVSVDNHGDVHPNQQMTHAAFVKLLVDAFGEQTQFNPQVMNTSGALSALGSVPKTSPDYQALGAAYAMGWLSSAKPFLPDALTTRDYAAQILARALHFTPLLATGQAFQLKANDSGKISPNHMVADALAVSLGMLPLQNGDFNPDANLNLADTAVAVVRAAEVLGQEGVQTYPRTIQG